MYQRQNLFGDVCDSDEKKGWSVARECVPESGLCVSSLGDSSTRAWVGDCVSRRVASWEGWFFTDVRPPAPAFLLEVGTWSVQGPREVLQV